MEKQGVLLTMTLETYAILVVADDVRVKQVWEQNGMVCAKLTGEGLPGPYVEHWSVYRPGQMIPTTTEIEIE
jgi:hypothetical protein